MARDERGRYHSLKEIAANGPSWASGCDACDHGIIAAPELTKAAPLYLERLVQAADGDIEFCSCMAGQRYRVGLQNRWRIVTEQDKRDQRIVTHKTAGSEQALTPENTLRISSPIAIARDAIEAARMRNRPTIHADGRAEEAERVMA